MSDLLVIGNKSYEKFEIDRIIDSFDYNVRCNLGFPGNNNGTKADQLALCSHLYNNLVARPAKNCKEFARKYKHAFIEKESERLFEDFKDLKPKFNRIFHAQFRTGLYNKYLLKQGCPHKFTKIPRTGYTVIMENLLKGNSVVVTNFSIELGEERVSFYTKRGTDSVCHSARDEVGILRWLHQKKKVDATMCLLEDVPDIRFMECGLSPTDFMREKIEGVFLSLKEKQEEIG